MSLFPRFTAERTAKAANPAKVPVLHRETDMPVSNFRNFSSPAAHEFQQGASDISQCVADLADAWHERMAICLEAGDISEAEAEITAALEVGRAFVRMFVHDQQEGPALIPDTSREVTRLD